MKKFIFAIAFFILSSIPVYATESIQHQSVTLSVYNLSSENNKPIENTVFTLYAAEDVYNTANEVIIPKDTTIKSVTTDKNGLAQFSFSVPVGRYYIKQMAVPSGYIIDNTPIYIDIITGQNEYNETIYNTYRDGNLYIEATAQESVPITDTYQVGIALKNNSLMKVNNFILVADMPMHTELMSISTGKYNTQSIISVYFKTNLSTDWLLWRSVMSDEPTVLVVSDIGLPENAYVRSVMVDYGNVDAAYQTLEGAGVSFQIRAGNTLQAQEVLSHNVTLSGYVDGTKSSCHAHADVVVSEPVAQTSDEESTENNVTEDEKNKEERDVLAENGSVVSPVATSQDDDSGSTTSANSPETGDGTVWIPYVVMMIVLLVAAVVTLCMIGKRKKC